MIKKLKEIWSELGRSIYVGERYRNNMRGLAIGASMIVIVNLITGCMKLRKGYTMGALSSLILILFFSAVFYLIAVKKNRKLALTVTTFAVIIIYGYDVVTVTTPIMPLWTLLFPWAFSYLVSVKSGFGISAFFTLLYVALFYTPLQQFMEGKYPEFMLDTFPLLYLANAVLCVYIMVQYHMNTLRQTDYAEQLVEAKDAADRASAAKSDFLANMSHEIRTPINAVLGMNEMILRESRNARALPGAQAPDVQAALESIGLCAGDVESAGSNLLGIVNDILDFSRIEAGRMDLAEAPYHLSSLLNDVSGMILFRARDKGLKFVVDVDETLPEGLRGDVVRVRQVIVTLLSNAVKYTEKGSVRLTLRGERKDGTLLLRAVVEDTGIGIRTEDLERLFTRFERLDMKRNSTVEGTGLGLVITKRLLDLMGGDITVESEYGKGSVFTVTIPQKIVSETPVGDFQKRFDENVLQAGPYRESFCAPEARVLIVDDTKMNLTVAAGLLKNTLVRIDTASGGAEAIELAASTAYDVILMDQRMPEMDGTEALHRIRADAGGQNADTPVICLTADAVMGAKERYLSEGFSDYLTKPVDGRALERMLIKHLPPEKVEIIREEPAPAPGAAAARPDCGFAGLRDAGIDTDTGLRYCRGEADFYRTVLDEYAQGWAEKAESLDRCFEAEDWKSYAVLVHALKSSSKMIGALELGEQAAALEQAADASDAEKIRASHGAMLEAYGKTASAIRAALPAGEPPDAEDGDVLEFMPEGQ